MTQRADLHLHTTASDGGYSPAEVVNQAAALSIDVLSITDHDTVSGIPEALSAAQAAGLTLIPGIELSCGGEEEVHLLGYGFADGASAIQDFLDEMIAQRRARMTEMLKKAEALGIPLGMEDIESSGNPFVGRMHLARALIRQGVVSGVRQAFSKYLSPGRPLYVPRRKVDVRAGIQTLKDAGAVVVLAHPGRLPIADDLIEPRLAAWVDAGLDGIEAYHESHKKDERRRFARLAHRYSLLVTGGSDFHGGLGSPKIGGHLPAWHSVDSDVGAFLERVVSGDAGGSALRPPPGG